VLQRPKSLPHVVEFTERRIDLVLIAGITGLVLPIVLTAAAQVHDEDNGDEAKSNESGNDEVHGWGTLRVPVHKRFPLAAHSWHPPVVPRCRQSFPRASSGCIHPLTTPVTPRLSIDRFSGFECAARVRLDTAPAARMCPTKSQQVSVKLKAPHGDGS
jgi:hypothetical protein